MQELPNKAIQKSNFLIYIDVFHFELSVFQEFTAHDSVECLYSDNNSIKYIM